MQSSGTFLFVCMQCKVQEVVFCHSVSVLAQLPGLMMMSHAYPLLMEFIGLEKPEKDGLGPRIFPEVKLV